MRTHSTKGQDHIRVFKNLLCHLEGGEDGVSRATASEHASVRHTGAGLPRRTPSGCRRSKRADGRPVS